MDRLAFFRVFVSLQDIILIIVLNLYYVGIAATYTWRVNVIVIKNQF